MPSSLIFHIGNALALGCLHDDSRRLALAFLSLSECISDLVEVVTVDADYVEVECFELLVDRIR